MSAAVPGAARAEGRAVSSRLLLELPVFGAMRDVMLGGGYTPSALARVRLLADGAVHVRLVWRRGDGACAVLRQPLTGPINDRLITALSDALL